MPVPREMIGRMSDEPGTGAPSPGEPTGAGGGPGRGGARHHRPVLVDPSSTDGLPDASDPRLRDEVAHATAQVLVHRGRASDDPTVLARLTALVEDEGLDVVADLWSHSPAGTLPGALWRLYLLREWVRRDPQTVADRYRQGMVVAPVQDVVAGVVTPPGPQDVRRAADEVLGGVYSGDLAVALERAAAFCRVLAAGAALDADHLDLADPSAAARQTQGASALVRTAEELADAARSWRAGTLD